jgi:hypothetical protein
MFTQEDIHAINTIRVLAADTVFKSNSGHPGMSIVSFFSESIPCLFSKTQCKKKGIYFCHYLFLFPLAQEPILFHPY